MISLFIALLIVSACALQCAEPNFGKLGPDVMRRVITYCDYKTLCSCTSVSKAICNLALNMPEDTMKITREQVLSYLSSYYNPVPTNGAWNKLGGYRWIQSICNQCLGETCKCSVMKTPSLFCHAGLQWQEGGRSLDVAIFKMLIPSPVVKRFLEWYRQGEDYKIVQMSVSLPIPKIADAAHCLSVRDYTESWIDQHGNLCVLEKPLCEMPDYVYRLSMNNTWQSFACKLVITGSVQESDCGALVSLSLLKNFPVFLNDFVKQHTRPYQHSYIQNFPSGGASMVFPWKPSFLNDVSHARELCNLLLFTICREDIETMENEKSNAIYIKAAVCAQYGGSCNWVHCFLKEYDGMCRKTFYDVHSEEGGEFAICQEPCTGRHEFHEFRDFLGLKIAESVRYSSAYRRVITWSPLAGILMWEHEDTPPIYYKTCSRKNPNVKSGYSKKSKVKIEKIIDEFSQNKLIFERLEDIVYTIKQIGKEPQILRADNEHFVEIRQCSHYKNILKTRLFVHEPGCKPARGWRPLAYGELHNCIGTIIRAIVDVKSTKWLGCTGSLHSLSLIEERMGKDEKKIFVRHAVIPSLLKRDPSEPYFNDMKDPVDAAAGSIFDDSGEDNKEVYVQNIDAQSLSKQGDKDSCEIHFNNKKDPTTVGTIVDNLDAVTDKGPVVGILTRFFCQTVACVRDTISSYVVTPTRFVWNVLSMIAAYHSSFSCS
jgi:hypothetical protein